MANGIKIPGVIYSLVLAVAAWAIDYFSVGAGGGIPWAPILIATIPILLKMITVQAPEPVQPASTTRGFDDEPAEQPTKVQRFLLG